MRRRALACVVIAAALSIPAAPADANRAAILAQPHAARPLHASLPCLGAVLICPGHAIGSAVHAVGHLVTGAVGAVAGSVMSGVVSWAADGAAWLVKAVAKQIDHSATPALGSTWFKSRYGQMVELAAPFAAIFLLLAVGQAIWAQDPWRLLRATFLSQPFALLMTFAAVTLVQLGLAVTDWMTDQVLSGTGGEVKSAFKVIALALIPTATTGLAPFALFLTALIVSLLSLLVWFELVMREAAVYVAVSFLPLTLVAMVWERTTHWSRRLDEWLASLILAKFAIAAAFALAAAAIVKAPSSGGGGFSALLAGCSVLLVAALTPWALMRMIPMAEAAAERGLNRGHVMAAGAAVPGAGTAAFAARHLALTNLSGGSARVSSLAAEPASQPQVATPPPAPDARLPQLPPERDRHRSRS